MVDWITVGSLIGLIVFGMLYRQAPDKVWYIDLDNAPVSMKAVFGLLWWICLIVLFMKLTRIGNGMPT